MGCEARSFITQNLILLHCFSYLVCIGFSHSMMLPDFPVLYIIRVYIFILIVSDYISYQSIFSFFLVSQACQSVVITLHGNIFYETNSLLLIHFTVLRVLLYPNQSFCMFVTRQCCHLSFVPLWHYISEVSCGVSIMGLFAMLHRGDIGHAWASNEVVV